jgi:threonine/homoserine/homoserine lactone efflux protein
VLRIVGAIYLVWLGLAALRGGKAAAKTQIPTHEAFRRGFLTNATNPKVIVFFAAFLPQFVVPGSVPVAVQLLGLGAAFMLVGLAFDVSLAFAAGALGRRLVDNTRALRVFDRVAGLVMIALGIELFSAPRSA